MPPMKTPSIPADIHTIQPTAVYYPDDVRRVLRLKATTIRSEVKQGRLRIARRAGRYYLLGKWLLEWLETGELKRKVATAA